MPAKKPNQYTVLDKPFKTFPSACARAVDASLQSGEMITIVEHNPNTKATYYIGVQASTEEA